MATLHVYVTPKSGRNEISGWRGGELLLRVTAPPEDGKANAAVCKLLSKALGVPKSAVLVTRGETSRHKTVEVDGLEQAATETVLGIGE
ncbi:MAG: hypothetical protein CVT66_00855 [Actinobacteria bacterium HGW-Actinobacteria-6]|nr:MAG: hypothetical protein CVT66_00855 [Actinobacteria bacterium HGW-Actinobacteria-6]